MKQHLDLVGDMSNRANPHAPPEILDSARQSVARWRVGFGRSQSPFHRIRIGPQPDAPEKTSLEGRRPSTAEWVVHDIAGLCQPADEKVRDGGRKHRHVGAQRVQAVAPSAWSRMPWQFPHYLSSQDCYEHGQNLDCLFIAG